jgi:hypothetical protein
VRESGTRDSQAGGDATESVSFSARDFVAVLSRAEPGYLSIQDYHGIRLAVQERKNYPIPEPELPGLGKSFEAQGQTKRPGSHSHDRHK